MPIDPPHVLSGDAWDESLQRHYNEKKHHFNLKRCSQYAPCPTITAMGSSENTAGPFHWSEPRKLTIGELKRVMSLPDDFVLTGKWSQKAERCGRMVPPIMMKRIADSIYEKILKQ